MKIIDTEIFGDFFSKFYFADMQLKNKIGRLIMINYNGEDSKYKKIYVKFKFKGDGNEFGSLKNKLLTIEDKKVFKEQYELPEAILNKLPKSCCHIVEALYSNSNVIDITHIKKFN